MKNGLGSRIEVGLLIIDSVSLDTFETIPVNNLGELKKEELVFIPKRKHSLSITITHEGPQGLQSVESLSLFKRALVVKCYIQ
ncbi:hypothetical protein ACJIZ3_017580 [Penstemon smallii]|uniref:Uncharacterized protein n=1 Tax=Penstemon smallii TaxID=265156 RepID=A0ABD3SX41_9LAMI